METVAGFTATKRQAINFVSIQIGPSTPQAGFKINVDVMQRLFPCPAFLRMYALIRVSGSNEEDLPFSDQVFDSSVKVF